MSQSTYKVREVADKYGVSEYDFVGKWTGEDSMGLRTIAEDFNAKLVGGALRRADRPELEEPDYIYQVLTGDEGTPRTKKTWESRLREIGVDPDDLQDDFVSYSAVRRYLVEHEDAEKDTSVDEEEQLNRFQQSLAKLESRCETVIDDGIERLNKGVLSIGDPELVIEFKVHCRDCGREYPVSDLLRRRSCDCDADDNA